MDTSITRKIVAFLKITTVSQMLKFSFVGVLNTAIHYAVFVLLFNVFHLHYFLSSCIGYTLGLINSFLLNKKWTFKYQGKEKYLLFFKFVLVNLLALGINLGILTFLTAALKMNPNIGQIIAIIGSLIINFTGNKIWTFSQ